MKNIKLFFSGLFSQRFGPLAVLAVLICSISFITRLVLLIASIHNIDYNPLYIIGVFIIGFFYDLVLWTFFSIPVAVYCWLMKDSWFRTKGNRILLFIMFFICIFLLVLNAGAEYTFWEEFSTRYNFIAVDYLVYTTEVLGNIWQSYNIPLIGAGVLAGSILILFLTRKWITASRYSIMRFKKRTKVFFLYMLLPVASWFLVNNSFKNISPNNYNNELGGNGMYEFGAAYWQNELDYHKFYAKENDTTAFIAVKKLLLTPGMKYVSNDPFNIERDVTPDSPLHKWNIILISVESLSGDYMKYFGNTENITPKMDSLIPHSLFFSNFYASGTRTVRGLEALALAIPPTPGQSIIRRPNNSGMFTMGEVLKEKGYDCNFIYGGNAFFDNMGAFFGGNGYNVLDKSDIPKEFVHHETAWGIDDEGAFSFTLKECDKSFASGKLFFNHIMTVSNHRPYTYPEGRIDIPPTVQSRNGGVKYTDYAIGKFLKDAESKPWFKQTLFVIVADHCAQSAGKTELPVNNYHIPCIVYAPALLTPRIESRLTSQIDLAPTLLGMLNIPYRSKFYGYDMMRLEPGRERAFIGTYQNLGYIRNNKLVVLSPQRKVEMFRPDFKTGIGKAIPKEDSLVNEAISLYQSASDVFEKGLYKK